MDARLVDKRRQGHPAAHHDAAPPRLHQRRAGRPAPRPGVPAQDHPRALLGHQRGAAPADAPARLRLPDRPGRPLARLADGHAPPRRRARVLPRVPRDGGPAPVDPGQAVLAERRSRARPTRSGRCPGAAPKTHRALARRSRCPRRAGSSPSAATCTAARNRARRSASRAAATARWSATSPPTRPPATRSTRSARCCTSPTRRASAGGSRRRAGRSRKGERLKVTAAYDNTRPHTRVMGIDHVYVAPPSPRRPPALRARRRPTRRSSARSSPNPRADAAEDQRSRSPASARDGSARPTHHRRGAPRARSRGDASVRVARLHVRPAAADDRPRRDRPLALRRRGASTT